MQLHLKTPNHTDEVTALRTLFEDYLKTIYWSENALAKVFIALLDDIGSKDLMRLMAHHAANTKIHTDRIEKVFESVGIKPEEKKSESVACMIGESQQILSLTESGPVRDAAIIAWVQHVIHAEIASYGTLRSFALTLREEGVVRLLEKNLEDEKELDLKLSLVAEAYVNDEAANQEI